MEKIPKWLRYILAVPYGLLFALFVGIIAYISIRMFASPDSWYAIIVSFIYKNGINIYAMFWGINIMLPNHKFKITLILSIILGIIYSAIQGVSIVQGTMNLTYALAYIEIIIALIISCIHSFKLKFD